MTWLRTPPPYDEWARGVKIDNLAPDPAKAARNLGTVRHLVENVGLGNVEAARTVGWSKATYHRHRSLSKRG